MNIRVQPARAFVLLSAALAACALDPQTVGAVDGTGTAGAQEASSTMPSSGTTVSADPTVSGVSAGSGPSADTATTATGPVVRIRLRATADPWPHADGLAGQTPRDTVTAIRSLTLLDTGGSVAPLEVFDFGTEYVTAPQDPGSDTVVATIPVSELSLGAFDRARVGLAFIQFTVDATAHLDALPPQPGFLQAVYVLADGTLFDGVQRDLGWGRYTFGPIELDNNNGLPDVPPDSPFALQQIDGGSFVEFDVSLLVDPSIDNDVDAILQLNVHEAFRWQDVDALGAPDVFDITPTSFEPVLRVGANDYSLQFG